MDAQCNAQNPSLDGLEKEITKWNTKRDNLPWLSGLTILRSDPNRSNTQGLPLARPCPHHSRGHGIFPQVAYTLLVIRRPNHCNPNDISVFVTHPGFSTVQKVRQSKGDEACMHKCIGSASWGASARVSNGGTECVVVDTIRVGNILQQKT